MDSRSRRAIAMCRRELAAALSDGILTCEMCPCFIPLDRLCIEQLDGVGLCCQFGFDDLFVTSLADGACWAFEREVEDAAREAGERV